MERILIGALGAAQRGVGGGGGAVPEELDVIHSRIRDDVVRALSAIQVLAHQAARILLLDVLRDEAGRSLELVETPTTRLWCLSLGRTCTQHFGGPCLLPELARALDQVDPGSYQTLAVHRLADEWNAAGALVLFGRKWAWLQEKLSGDATDAVRFATEERVTAAPLHCDSAWDALLHLVGHTAPPGGVPPWMLLMVRLGKELGGADGRELFALTRKTALEKEQSPELAARLDALAPRVLRTAHVPSQASDYLIIGVTHEDRSVETYRVSYWLQLPGDPEPIPGRGHRTADREHLEIAVDEVVSLAEEEEGAGQRRGELQLEIVLPLELLNLDVHGWFVGRPGPQAELAAHYPFVVRSLDRLRNHSWHRVWRQRWDQLEEPGSKHKFMDPVDFPPGTGDLTRLVAQLKEEPYVAVVLSGPPEHERSRGWREAEAALRTGTPVLVWHRTEETNEEIRRYVRRLIRPRLAELPTKVTVARRRHLAQAQDSPSRHLAVLWDDPDRNPYAPPRTPFAPDDPLGSGAL
ncbi:hypothetical protein ACFY1L_24880 [Streptomyces sp. NPDC001663]|uniref:VMAP-C domain-containing protein n=1 Tax=Streptomyces sp. NPDC001663 TaxID=3364597 RepID=UPI003684E574